ncbi:MAG TPA: hypothetical protein VEZ71_16280 [Archangium sp.]|nr:hypothetical protein [Archangium sp.]
MSTSLLTQLATGPLFALLTAATYRGALWMLGGAPMEGHVRWGVGFSVVALLLAWSRAYRRPASTAIELERDNLREAADEALAALSDADTAWTPAGTDARQALRLALGHPPVPVCGKCHVDMGGHSHGCSESPVYIRDGRTKGGVA